MIIPPRVSFWCIVMLSLALAACGLPTSVFAESVIARTPESDYVTNPSSYSGSNVTISGVAYFERFDDYLPSYEVTSNCGQVGQPTCASGLVHVSTTNPIRYAEIYILTSAGARVQQGETDGSGNFSMSIPVAAGSYVAEVHSRADNAKYHASVLNNPYDDQYYKASLTFSLTGSETGTLAVGTITAPHNGTLEGGAFNILDQIYNANDFLRNHTTSGANDCPTGATAFCISNFTAAPKIQVFWTKGVTPASYYGDNSTATSFFVAQSTGNIYRGLYILGGLNGDVCADTDHFDNSVIIHEYGHFMEDAFGKSDSPGGAHDGNKIIDPRLAWSEGWADYFQAAVLGRSIYRDTSRNSECPPVGSSGHKQSAQLSFTDFDLENQTLYQDVPTQIGEGNFREVSISRALYDTQTGPSQSSLCSSTDHVCRVPYDGVAANAGFGMIWGSFRSFANSNYHFRSSMLFNQNLFNGFNTYAPSYIASWANNESNPNPSAVLTNEFQYQDLRFYGQPLSYSTTACASPIANQAYQFLHNQPVTEGVDEDGYLTWSDPFHNNRFFRIDWDGNAAHAVVQLNYSVASTNTAMSTTPYDLDLYLYDEKHTLLDPTTIILSSANTYPESAGNGFEQINLTGLPHGTYLLDIKVNPNSTLPDYDTPSPVEMADTSFTLTSPGVYLCP